MEDEDVAVMIDLSSILCLTIDKKWLKAFCTRKAKKGRSCLAAAPIRHFVVSMLRWQGRIPGRFSVAPTDGQASIDYDGCPGTVRVRTCTHAQRAGRSSCTADSRLRVRRRHCAAPPLPISCLRRFSQNAAVSTPVSPGKCTSGGATAAAAQRPPTILADTNIVAVLPYGHCPCSSRRRRFRSAERLFLSPLCPSVCSISSQPRPVQEPCWGSSTKPWKNLCLDTASNVEPPRRQRFLRVSFPSPYRRV